ncbi:hypothetical protein N8T08_002626 [Aspergillus melleus]|uniref:Uncharacterized protein n=1 Tax=Aspergillus melleus TaxID=138277 RepID=A0ACC3ALR2_9EURO|nr:hypothetical protein N8T08_002626 [Aspergillus melleus]
MIREFKNSTGNALPWNLSPRLLPFHRVTRARCSAVHKIESIIAPQRWEAVMTDSHDVKSGLLLPAGTQHKVDVEMRAHITAFLRIRFKRPDVYQFQGAGGFDGLGYIGREAAEEVFTPFHFRKFRFLNIQIDAGSADLVLLGLDIETVNYLETHASFKVESGTSSEDQMWQQLWDTSLRTLSNCMHDGYEDCPFYEQLQYAMDTRSSFLFTYSISGDDRLARQAIMQLHNTFRPQTGLTASRAPTHRLQFIPHFSLYWIYMIGDHLIHGLVTSEVRSGIWNFVDWTDRWKPHGVPPAIERVGISTFTNQLYAYMLSTAAQLVTAARRLSMAQECQSRAKEIIDAVKVHCYDGEFFADTLVTEAKPVDYSLHCQVWADLSGTISGPEAQGLLRKSLQKRSASLFAEESVSMSFYTLRALRLAGAQLYEENFHNFWKPWQDQLSQYATTWVEDSVSK